MKTTIFKPAPLGSLVLETRILTDGTRFDAMTQDNAGSGAVIAAGFVPSSALADPEDTGRTTVLSDKEIFFHQMYLQMEALIWTPVFAGLTHPGEAALPGQPLELPSVDSDRSYGREARRMKTAECEMLVSEFASAAKAAKAAHYAGVLIEMGKDSLLGAFLSPETNGRDDKYGGNVFKRMRLSAETVTAVKASQPDFPLIVAYDTTRNGRTDEEMLLQLAFIEEAGADAFLLEGEEEPEFIQRLRESCEVPVIRRPSEKTVLSAIRLLNEGKADFALI